MSSWSARDSAEQSVAERAAGMFARYRIEPPPTAEEPREAFEIAVAEEIAESLERSS